MAWCLKAPSHDLNQCRLWTKCVLWHSPESNSTRSAHNLNPSDIFRDDSFKITTMPCRDQWVNNISRYQTTTEHIKGRSGCNFWGVLDSPSHYDDVIMGAIASLITSLTIVYSTVYSDADQRKHQSSASLAFVWGIHRGPVNSPHKWPVTRKMFPFDDVIMIPIRCTDMRKHTSTKNSEPWTYRLLHSPGMLTNCLPFRMLRR